MTQIPVSTSAASQITCSFQKQVPVSWF